jgi:hypothetical protein
MKPMTNRLTLALVAALSWGCSSQPPETAADFKPATTMMQLMEWVLDPSADVVWASVGTIISASGTEEIVPQTDEEWANVRNHAAIIAEGGNLLMMETHARAGQDWIDFSHGLTDAALLAVKAAEAKDKEALFDAGGRIYSVCAACHQQFIFGGAQ